VRLWWVSRDDLWDAFELALAEDRAITIDNPDDVRAEWLPDICETTRPHAGTRRRIR
jgi:hypothetical protein